jgi:hypothetical protein
VKCRNYSFYDYSIFLDFDTSSTDSKADFCVIGGRPDIAIAFALAFAICLAVSTAICCSVLSVNVGGFLWNDKQAKTIEMPERIVQTRRIWLKACAYACLTA